MVEIWIAALGILTVAAFTFVGQSTEDALFEARTATKAGHVIRLNVALSHLRLEESLGGNSAVDLTADVQQPLTDARELCLAHRRGGPHELGRFPRPDGDRKAQLTRLCSSLDRLISATHSRSANTVPDAPSEVEYQAASTEALSLSEENLTTSELAIEKLVRRNDDLRFLLVVVIFTLFVVAFVLIRRYLAQLRRRASELEDAYDKVEAALAQARRFERLRANMVSNISHELRTPLVPILGWSQFLSQRPATDPDQVQEYADTIHRGAQRLSDLVEDFLRISTRSEDVSISKISVDDVLDALAHEIKSRGGKPRTSIEDNIRAVVTDRQRLVIALTYLADNAVKFGPSGGLVDVQVSNGQNGSTIFSVIDDGPGISETVKDHFDLFVQGDGGTTREQGGTGAGLFLASSIAEEIGGHLDADNEPGRGARFSIVLPADDEMES